MYEAEQKCIQSFSGKTSVEDTTLKILALWCDQNKMDLKETRLERVQLIHLP